MKWLTPLNLVAIVAVPVMNKRFWKRHASLTDPIIAEKDFLESETLRREPFAGLHDPQMERKFAAHEYRAAIIREALYRERCDALAWCRGLPAADATFAQADIDYAAAQWQVIFCGFKADRAGITREERGGKTVS